MFDLHAHAYDCYPMTLGDQFHKGKFKVTLGWAGHSSVWLANLTAMLCHLWTIWGSSVVVMATSFQHTNLLQHIDKGIKVARKEVSCSLFNTLCDHIGVQTFSAVWVIQRVQHFPNSMQSLMPQPMHDILSIRATLSKFRWVWVRRSPAAEGWARLTISYRNDNG